MRWGYGMALRDGSGLGQKKLEKKLGVLGGGRQVEANCHSRRGTATGLLSPTLRTPHQSPIYQRWGGCDGGGMMGNGRPSLPIPSRRAIQPSIARLPPFGGGVPPRSRSHPFGDGQWLDGGWDTGWGGGGMGAWMGGWRTGASLAEPSRPIEDGPGKVRSLLLGLKGGGS